MQKSCNDLQHDVRQKDINIGKIHSTLIYVGLAHARPNYAITVDVERAHGYLLVHILIPATDFQVELIR